VSRAGWPVTGDAAAWWRSIISTSRASLRE
jgi:hypothetical protein